MLLIEPLYELEFNKYIRGKIRSKLNSYFKKVFTKDNTVKENRYYIIRNKR